MKIFYLIAGISLSLVALVMCGLFFLAILFPVSFKGADSDDPFGPPPSRIESFCGLCAFVVVGAGGGYLVRKAFRSAP